MSELVTKAEAMAFLVYDEEPAGLDLLIEAASQAVIDYLGDAADTFVDSSGDVEDSLVPATVKLATLVWMREMDQNREGAKAEIEKVDAKHGYGYPPEAVVRLLYRLRDPVMA